MIAVCHYCTGMPSHEINEAGRCAACDGTRVHPVGDDPHDDGEGWDGADCGVCAVRFEIRMTSKRSGAVAWIRPDGTPANHRSEAGRFTGSAALAVIAEYTEQLVRVIGRCANTFDLIESK